MDDTYILFDLTNISTACYACNCLLIKVFFGCLAFTMIGQHLAGPVFGYRNHNVKRVHIA